MSAKILNLKKKKRSWLGKRELAIIVLAFVMTVAGIKASDSLLGERDKDVLGLCPDDMVHIPFASGDFCIDAFEASAGEGCVFTSPEGQVETRTNLDATPCVPVSKIGGLPWRFISLDQARRACAKAGKRLPTNKEWQQAALGTPDLSADWDVRDCQVDSNWENQPGRTGFGANCISPFGAYDMVGNVWEWVDASIENGQIDGAELPSSGYVSGFDNNGWPEGVDNRENPDYNHDYFWIKSSGLRGVARGGYWNNKQEAGVYAFYAVTPPDSVEGGIGFRCVK